MAGILDKRNSLHRRLAQVENFNSQLKTEIGHIQPLANIGLISAMIAHEMNNILTPIGTYAELAMGHLEDDEADDDGCRDPGVPARVVQPVAITAG